MEKELVRVEKREVGGRLIQTVNARELHEFLGSERQFANWIQERIDEYGFVEGEEFLTELLKTPSGAGGRPSREYHISLDMGKELAMVERTEKGRQARKYFIECERRLREQAPSRPALPAPEGQAFQSGIRRGMMLMAAVKRHLPKETDLEEYLYFRKQGLDTARAEAAFGMAPGSAARFEQELVAAGIHIRPDRSGLKSVEGRLVEMVSGEEVSLKPLPVSSDALGDFVREVCLLEKSAAIRTLVLYGHYRNWCIESHRYMLGFRRFVREITSRFAVLKYSSYGKERRAHFLGITLKTLSPKTALDEFVENCCVLDPRESIGTRELYNALRNWTYSKGNGDVVGRQLFLKAISESYAGRIGKRNVRRKTSFTGIALKKGGER